MFAGLVNVVRPEHHIGWQLACAFGLLHGFGFAGALAELGLGGAGLLLQLALTLLPRYRNVLVPLMSAGGAGMGVIWVASRL